MKMENGEWKMNDTVYGVSLCLVLHEMYTVGCADLGAPSLTIVTCVTVGANIVRPETARFCVAWPFLVQALVGCGRTLCAPTG